MTIDPLFAAGVGVEATVIALSLRRKFWQSFPFFFAYLSWTLLCDVAAPFVQSNSPALYLRYYLIEFTVDSLLQFCVLVELTWSVLQPVRASLPKSTLGIIATLLAVSAIVIWPLTGGTVPPGMTGRSDRLLFHLDEIFSILRVGLFLVMASLSQVLSIGWRDRELQIATGLGFYSIISLLVSLLHSHQLPFAPGYHFLDIAESVSYLGTLTYWVYSFATKEPERKEFSPQMQQFLLQMSGGVRTGRIALANLSERDCSTREEK